MSDGRLKILYVEDDEDIQAIAQIALVDVAGFEVRSCLSGEQALEVAQSFTPNLLILDVMMPHMDGPQTLQELRKLPDFKTIPVIFMTAKVQPDEVARYMQLGALTVINKPFDPMTLGATISGFMEKK